MSSEAELAAPPSSVALRTAVEWGVIDRVPCSIKLLRAPKSAAAFHDFSDFEKLVEAAKADGPAAHLIVLLGGEAGLRCGEIMALEWPDIDFANRQLAIGPTYEPTGDFAADLARLAGRFAGVAPRHAELYEPAPRP